MDTKTAIKKSERNWGGARAGAGRKPAPERLRSIHISLPKSLVARLDEECAKRTGQKAYRATVIREALEAYLT